jgi:hypothetical protein
MAKRSDGSKPGRKVDRKLDDVALVFGRTDDQEGLQILRRRGDDHPVELGTLRPLREGRPIAGEVISLKPRGDYPFLCDVKVEVPQAEITRGISDGPAQVATDDYRTGWEAIFGRRARPPAKVN